MIIKTSTDFSREAEAILVFTTNDKIKNTLIQFAHNKSFYNLIQPFFRSRDYLNRANEVFIFPNSTMPKRIVFAHIKQGADKNIELEDFRKVASAVVEKVRSASIEVDFTQIYQLTTEFSLEVEDIIRSVCEGFLLGGYSFDVHKKKSDEKSHKNVLKEITLISGEVAMSDIVNEETNLCGLTLRARDLVNEPSNVLTTERFSKEASSLGKRMGVTVNVLSKAQLQKAKMGGILAVNAGSSAKQEARLVCLEYQGLPQKKKGMNVLIVGKGVVFDSGGISLKPAAGMGEMKMDMAGGAAALGAILAVASNGLPINVTTLIPLTDNKPGASAINPGDIITMYNGTSVEVDNTDAEGRLILADALAYGIEKFKPTYVVDIATLTGASIIALGHSHAALLSNDEALQTSLISAGKYTGEKVWPLPLSAEYQDLLKSDVADLKNVGGRAAGTITAAKFLEHFVDKKSWAHLDIAGTAILDKPYHYLPKGGSGYGVRLLYQWIKTLSIS